MPTYQYACTECEHGFEAVQKFSDDALTECPECSGRLRKVFSAVGVVFKGHGFYRTDSRAAAGAKPKDSGTSSSDGSSSSSSSSTGSSSTGSSPTGSSPTGSSSSSSSSGSAPRSGGESAA
ncbi:MAG TPA: FmdB family zinc ribbon protein [Sporichthya sp.]|nr:FmdB family zinc ribbon protein [Sporichthya sp.]